MDPIWLMNTSHITYHNEPQLEALPFYPWQIIVILIYSTTAFISLGSNTLTIIILLRNEQVSTELWKFLLNLSISDALMAAFCIPFTYTNYMLGRWIFPHFLCPIIPFFQITSVSVSIWTLTIIGIDRFFAIIYPFHSLLWLKRHKVITIGFIWLLGSMIALPQLFYSRIEPFKYRGIDYYDCREQLDADVGKIYTIFIFLSTFFIPILALIFVYSRICIHLIRNSSAPGNPDQNRDKVCINKKIKVIRMLVTIVVLFAMCWFPLHLFQLLVWFYPSIQHQKTIFSYYLYIGSFFLCHWLAMAHSSVNPFVYCFMSDNFRKNLRKTLNKCLPHQFIQIDRSSNLPSMDFTRAGDGASSGGGGNGGGSASHLQDNNTNNKRRGKRAKRIRKLMYDDDDDDENLTMSQIHSITTLVCNNNNNNTNDSNSCSLKDAEQPNQQQQQQQPQEYSNDSNNNNNNNDNGKNTRMDEETNFIENNNSNFNGIKINPQPQPIAAAVAAGPPINITATTTIPSPSPTIVANNHHQNYVLLEQNSQSLKNEFV